MGEATYYMKARFESQEAAEQAADKAVEFFARINLCQARWQANRRGGQEADEALRDEFPDVFAGLKIERPSGYDQSLNYLAGKLDAPNSDAAGISVVCGVVGFCATVWHFADWDGLAAWFESIGALKTGWVSDEYADLFDLIDVERED